MSVVGAALIRLGVQSRTFRLTATLATLIVWLVLCGAVLGLHGYRHEDLVPELVTAFCGYFIAAYLMDWKIYYRWGELKPLAIDRSDENRIGRAGFAIVGVIGYAYGVVQLASHLA